MQTYLATIRDLGIQTWLMHGSLLGWWWGKKVMPWDFDADVMVSEADMYMLAAYHNMTTYHYRYESAPEGRTFLLEVNPHFVHREWDDRLNVIDARWIDIQTGLFIDITAARYAVDHPRGEGVLFDKNGHEFRVSLAASERPVLTSRTRICIRCWTRRLRASRSRFRLGSRRCSAVSTGRRRWRVQSLTGTEPEAWGGVLTG